VLRREFVPYLHLSQTIRRVLTKPRGYARDFLTIDCMFRNETGGVAPLGPLVDRLFLDRPVARAVRNRRGLLANEIALAVARGNGSAAVTSLACGPATELFDVFCATPGLKLQATLIDIDFQALAFVADRRDAEGLTKRMRLEHGNLVHLATGRTVIDLKDQNLVYSIGLIDYFEDRFFIALLNWIHGCLAPGG
jgi:extracellular factor (EF) 3-hydroxypalmitic acid methyl ester biosynthesis protein